MEDTNQNTNTGEEISSTKGNLEQNKESNGQNQGESGDADGAADKNRNIASSYHDTERVSLRANEASDRNDSNTGGMISGGAKGASQS